MDWYKHIIPCGIKNKGVTSLSKELNRTVGIEEIIPQFLKSFSETFDCSCTDLVKDEVDTILSNVKLKC